MPRTRVVIADDHALMREGIRALLAKADDIEVVGEAEDGRQAIDRCKDLEPTSFSSTSPCPLWMGSRPCLRSGSRRPRPRS